MLVGGSLLALGGIGLAFGTLGMSKEAAGSRTSAFVFSGISLGGAAGLLVGGVRRHLAYSRWKAEQTDAVPPQGGGLITSGAVLVPVGSTITAAAVALSFGYMINPEPDEVVPPLPRAVLGIGLGSIMLGTALLIVGMHRHDRFKEWRRGGLARVHVEMLPTFAPLPGGGQIGLVGRFRAR